MVSVTGSPGFRLSGFQPRRICCCGGPISNAHCVGRPSLVLEE
jgi:hypothetical protein